MINWESQPIQKAEEKISHGTIDDAREAVHQALNPLKGPEEYKEALTLMQHETQKNTYGNVLSLDFEHNIAHLTSNPKAPIADSKDFVIVMPGQTLDSISKYEIENGYGRATKLTGDSMQYFVNALDADIVRLNPFLSDKNTIQAGQLLELPNHFLGGGSPYPGRKFE